MITTLLAGVAAGLGIAIPVGAISILIVETGLRRGFRLAVAAGAGAATVDGLYALIAAAFGAALASALAPWERPLRVVAVVALVAIALRGLMALRALARPATLDGDSDGAPVRSDVEAAERGGSAARTYGVFVAITVLNPVTVTYFAALILGLGSTGIGSAEKAAFVLGAFLASLAWQTLLAAVGAFLHRRFSPRLRAGVVLLGNAIILAFALVIGAGLAS